MKLRKRTQLFVKSGEGGEGKNHKKKPFTILRRNAQEVMNYRIYRKIFLAGIALATAILLIGYAFVLLYNRTGRFSVSVDEPDATFAITLSEDPKFISHSSRLVNDQQVKVDNICGNSLPADIDGKNGEHNGENYLAYTFYCKNVGSAPASLNYEVTYNNVTNGLDECIRVRLYVDGVYKDYAKARYDNTKEDHYCDESFVNKYTVCYGAVNCVEIDHYVRFTVVVWLEGDDEECNDSVLYGQIKIDMNIEAKAAIF